MCLAPAKCIRYYYSYCMLFTIINVAFSLKSLPVSVPYLWCLDFISSVDDLDRVHRRDEPGPCGLGGMDAGQWGPLQRRQTQTLVHSLPFHAKQSPATGDSNANCLQCKLMLQATSLSRLVSTSLFHSKKSMGTTQVSQTKEWNVPV